MRKFRLKMSRWTIGSEIIMLNNKVENGENTHIELSERARCIV